MNAGGKIDVTPMAMEAVSAWARLMLEEQFNVHGDEMVYGSTGLTDVRFELDDDGRKVTMPLTDAVAWLKGLRDDTLHTLIAGGRGFAEGREFV